MKRVVFASLVMGLIMPFSIGNAEKQVPAWASHAGEAITVDEAREMTGNFNGEAVKSSRAYSRRILQEMLDNDDVAAVRIYPGKRVMIVQGVIFVTAAVAIVIYTIRRPTPSKTSRGPRVARGISYHERRKRNGRDDAQVQRKPEYGRISRLHADGIRFRRKCADCDG